MEREEQRCPGCDSRKGGPCVCPDCRKLVNQGLIDEHGRKLVQGRIDTTIGREIHVSWSSMPDSIAFGLISLIDREQKYTVKRQVTLPNGRFKVVLEICS